MADKPASDEEAPRKKTQPAKAAPKSEPRKSHGRDGSAVKGTRLAHLGAEQLVELTRKSFEGIVGLERTDDGWTVQVELLEVRRIPETTDVIGVYEVEVDTSGELVGYRRVHRYLRGEAGEER